MWEKQIFCPRRQTCLRSLSYTGIVSKPAIVVFTKNVQPGHVKTRLSTVLDPAQTCRLYAALLDHTRTLLEQTPCIRFVYYDQYIDERDNWDNSQFVKSQQQGHDLRARMAAAASQIFGRGIAPLLILAADCPELSQAHIATAIEAMQQGKFVLGPTHSGGFYLLGLPGPAPWLFEGEWTEGQRGQLLLDRLKAQQVDYVCLQMLHDLTRPADLQLLAQHPLVTPYLPDRGMEGSRTVA